MNRSRRNSILLGLVGAVALGLSAGAWWLFREDGDGGGPAPVEAPPGIAVAAVEADPRSAPRVELVNDDAPAFTALDTTVVFPLEIDLKLVRAASTPEAKGVPKLGSGATASVAGSVQDASGKGARAEVRFVAGANAGRVLYTDPLGRFGADKLYPGLAVVRISGPGIAGAQRELRMRPQRETQFHVSFARPARVTAEVVDGEGKPLQGARVTLDGQEAESDAEGVVEFGAVAPGEVLVLVEKPGFASLRQSLTLPGAATFERGKLRFRLDVGATLQVSIDDVINGGQEALLFLLPEISDTDRRFPWQTVNPVKIWPGGTVVVSDLPTGRVTLRLYHAGAVAKPPRRSVELRAGGRENVVFHLEAGPVVTGTVTDQGGRAENAIVRLEAPDRVQATLSVFGQTNYLFLENDVLPDLPPAVQEATTNSRGEFQLSACEDVSPVRYLTARSRDGKRVAHVVLKPGDLSADLVLRPVEGGDAELLVETEDRWQPLPVEVKVDGTPRDPQVVPPGRDVRVSALPAGSWKVTVRWNGQNLVVDRALEIAGEARIHVSLPEGAIMGQDEETRRRSGRR